MSRVFFIERPTRKGIDVSSASAFGEIHILFSGEDRRPSIFDSHEFVDKVMKALAAVDFNPSEDLFCIAGSMVSVALSMIALSCYAQDMGSKVRLLLYDTTMDHYVEKQVHIGRLMGRFMGDIGDILDARTGT